MHIVVKICFSTFEIVFCFDFESGVLLSSHLITIYSRNIEFCDPGVRLCDKCDYNHIFL